MEAPAARTKNYYFQDRPPHGPVYHLARTGNDGRELFRDGKPIKDTFHPEFASAKSDCFTPVVLKVLEYLLQKAGEPLERDRLLDDPAFPAIPASDINGYIRKVRYLFRDEEPFQILSSFKHYIKFNLAVAGDPPAVPDLCFVDEPPVPADGSLVGPFLYRLTSPSGLGNDLLLLRQDVFQPGEKNVVDTNQTNLLVLKRLLAKASVEEQRRAPVAKRDLCTDVGIDESALDTAISVLRRILFDTAGGQRLIKSIPRKGYVFIPRVRSLPPESRKAAPPGASIEVRCLGSDKEAMKYVISCYEPERKLLQIRDTHLRPEIPMGLPQDDQDYYAPLQKAFGAFLERADEETRCVVIFGWPVDERYVRMVQVAALGTGKKIKYRQLKQPGPLMNFILLNFKDSPIEVLFGWGQGRPTSEGAVFWSRAKSLVDEFSILYEDLIRSSGPVSLNKLLESQREQGSPASGKHADGEPVEA